MADLILDEKLDRIFEAAKAAHDEDRMVVCAELLSTYVRFRPEHTTAWHIYGDALRLMGLYQEANRAYLTAYDIDKSAWVAGRLALLHHDQGKLVEAESWFESAERDPEVVAKGWHWILRGHNFFKLNEFSQAENCFRTAMGLAETDLHEAQLNLGLVLIAQGRYLEVTDTLQEALRIHPAYPEALTALKYLEGLESSLSLLRGIPSLKSP